MMVNDLIHTAAAWSDAASEALVLDRSRTPDAERMNHLIASRQARHIHDTIERQLDDLVCLRVRRRDLPDEELRAGRQALLAGADPAEYGRWVFYPWSARLV